MAYPLPARHAERGSVGPDAHAAHAATLALDQHGFIVECDPEIESLFGYRRGELDRRHISFLLPELARIPLLREGGVNPRLAFLCHCGKRFAAVRREGWSFFAELFVNYVEGSVSGPLLLMIRAAHTSHPAHARHKAEVFMDR